jgi:hypothetical protein
LQELQTSLSISKFDNGFNQDSRQSTTTILSNFQL